MAILNNGKESFINDLAGYFEAIQNQRQQFAESIRELNLSARGMFQLEATRLARKLGPEHPRAQDMSARVEHRLELLDALEVEVQIAKVRTPVVDSASALVHGRIVTAALKGVENLEVGLVTERGENLGISAEKTNDTGYFALEVKPEVLAKLGPSQNVLLSVAGEKGRVVPSAVKPFTIQAGDKTLIEAVLTPAELENVCGSLDLGRKPSPVTPERPRPVTPTPARPVTPEPPTPVVPEPARPISPEPSRPVRPVPARPGIPVRPVVAPTPQPPPTRRPPVKPTKSGKKKKGK